jgi:cyanophycinase-like exopeptidase
MTRKLLLIALVISLLTVISVATAKSVHKQGDGWEWYCIGSCDTSDLLSTKPKARSNTGGIALIGGGTDDDPAFKWLLEQGQYGHFVVIRTHGSDAYNEYVNGLGARAASTLIISSRTGSNNGFVNDIILSADSLFIAGGDQYEYWTNWTNTRVQESVQMLVDNGTSIGGTSAGMAVMGEFVYTCANGTSAESPIVLKNPFDDTMSFGRHFLHMPIMKNIITDTHFRQYDRIGRSMAFLARIWTDYPDVGIVKGIACDEQTAVIVQGGSGHVMTLVNNPQSKWNDLHTAYFFLSKRPPAVCMPDTPLTFGKISVWRLHNNQTFDLINWTSNQGEYYELDVEDGDLSSIGNGDQTY